MFTHGKKIEIACHKKDYKDSQEANVYQEKHRISIHKREAIANAKTELGHFEADLTFHKGNRSKNIGG